MEFDYSAIKSMHEADRLKAEQIRRQHGEVNGRAPIKSVSVNDVTKTLQALSALGILLVTVAVVN